MDSKLLHWDISCSAIYHLQSSMGAIHHVIFGFCSLNQSNDYHTVGNFVVTFLICRICSTPQSLKPTMILDGTKANAAVAGHKNRRTCVSHFTRKIMLLLRLIKVESPHFLLHLDTHIQQVAKFKICLLFLEIDLPNLLLDRFSRYIYCTAACLYVLPSCTRNFWYVW